jgi:DNA-binding MarR family transcriptional regulator
MCPVAAAARERTQATAQALEVVSSVVRLLREAAQGATPEAGGVSLTEFRLLKRLAAGVRLTRELAADLDMTAATISAAIDGLVRRGLVERLAPAGDRRAVPLVATEAGRVVWQAALQRQHEALAAVVEELSPAQRRGLQVALRGLTRALGGATPR